MNPATGKCLDEYSESCKWPRIALVGRDPTSNFGTTFMMSVTVDDSTVLTTARVDLWTCVAGAANLAWTMQVRQCSAILVSSATSRAASYSLAGYQCQCHCPA